MYVAPLQGPAEAGHSDSGGAATTWICFTMDSLKQFLRYLWAAPATLLGLVLAFALLWRGRAVLIDGVLEAHSPLLGRALTKLTPLAGGAAAITLGHVVIGRNAHALEVTRAHERVHVRQYEVWGPLFVPAYAFASLYALARGRHPYFDNRFEQQAVKSTTTT